MSTESIWSSFAGTTHFPQLADNLEVDVAIIGGGICGITLAQLLSESGKKIVVLEGHRVGMSSTGHSTGNLYETLGPELQQVRKKYSPEITRNVVLSRRDAIHLIERNVTQFDIDCDFVRVPYVCYSTNEETTASIEKEFDLGRELGLPLNPVELAHPSFSGHRALGLEGQAQMNPLRYVQGLSKVIRRDACQIFENTMVTDVTEEENRCALQTDQGYTVTARFVVHATHTPKGIMPYHNFLEPYREYGIACRIAPPQHPQGIYFGYRDPKSVISTRLYERDGEHFLIVVGSPHKVGHGDSDEHMKALEEFASKNFSVLEFTHRWGGQHYRPADELPYIGRKTGKSNVLIATGFSTHGLTYGTVAAMILHDAIAEIQNPYSSIYTATRFTPIKSAKNFLKENASVFYDFVKDNLRNDEAPFSDVGPGEGQIIDFEGHKLAVYKDEDVGLKICSAVCTHMACIVRWNKDEKSWDCPCHGSRFDTNGEVLEGPALKALARAHPVIDDDPVRAPLTSLFDNLQTGLGT